MVNNFKYKTDRFIFSENRQSNTKKIIISIMAIILALFVALFIAMMIYGKGDLFAGIIGQIFTQPFSSPEKVNSFLSSVAIYGVAGLAFIFAFKAGLFNIGISGQMLGGAIIATLIGQFMAGVPTGLGQILMLMIGGFSGMAIAGFIGYLKAYANVNEVVASIMINWIIYFIGTWLLTFAPGVIPGAINTSPITDNLSLRIAGESFIPLLIIFIILVGFTFVSLKYMTFGKKLINTGISPSASKYAGYSIKTNQISAMAISGFIAGILGIMVYCGKIDQMPISTLAKTIPQEGFNGISVGLIAMCNPIAVIPISIFFGMVESSKSGISQVLLVDPSIVDLIFGIILYGAAIISIFYWFRPWVWIQGLFKGREYLKCKKTYEMNLQNELQDASDALYYAKTQYKNSKLKSQYKILKKEIEIDCKANVKKIKNEYDIKLFNAKFEYQTLQAEGLKHKKNRQLATRNKFILAIQKSYFDVVEKISSWKWLIATKDFISKIYRKYKNSKFNKWVVEKFKKYTGQLTTDVFTSAAKLEYSKSQEDDFASRCDDQIIIKKYKLSTSSIYTNDIDTRKKYLEVKKDIIQIYLNIKNSLHDDFIAQHKKNISCKSTKKGGN